MATVNLQGNAVQLDGEFPQVGQAAADFQLTAADLSDKSLADFAGKRKILNIFPSVDTPVCAQSIRIFNEKASGLDNTVVLCVSADLPFAQARFCGAEGLDNVANLSTFRSASFQQDYGVALAQGPMKGLCARAVVVLDENNQVIHAQLVPEIKEEPDYAAALAVL